MDLEANVRQFKDFLFLYNSISEKCFNLCVTGFNRRDLGQAEVNCVDRCVGKQVSVNHKVMSVYAELQPTYIQKRIDEMNKQAEAQAQAQIELEQQQQQQIQTDSHQ